VAGNPMPGPHRNNGGIGKEGRYSRKNNNIFGKREKRKGWQRTIPSERRCGKKARSANHDNGWSSDRSHGAGTSSKKGEGGDEKSVRWKKTIFVHTKGEITVNPR